MRTRLHPNHLTVLCLAAGVSAGLLFAFAVETHAKLAATFFMLAVLIDHTDGELARMSGKCSPFGHKFDFVVGGINYTCLFASLGIGLGRGELGGFALMLGLAAGLANPFITILRMHMDARFGKIAVEHPRMGLIEIEDIIYLIGPFAWLGHIATFFVIFGLGALGYLAWTIMQYFHWQLGRSQPEDDAHAD